MFLWLNMQVIAVIYCCHGDIAMATVAIDTVRIYIVCSLWKTKLCIEPRLLRQHLINKMIMYRRNLGKQKWEYIMLFYR